MTEYQLLLYPVDATYSKQGNEFITKIYCVTKDYEKVILIDKQIKPYFYVISKTENLEYLHKKIKSLAIKEDTEIHRVLNVKKVQKYMGKKEVTALKIKVGDTKKIKLFRKIIGAWEDCEVLEADIPFIHRYLMDRKITLFHQHQVKANLIETKENFATFELKSITQISSEHLKPKTLAIDIETNSYMQPNIKEDSIVSISFYGSDNFKKVITWKHYPNAPDYVQFVSGEIELLEETKKAIDHFSPQIIVGWNSNVFDFQIIQERINKYKLENNFGWDHSKLLIDHLRNGADVHIAGYLMVDCNVFIRHLLAADLKTNRINLNAVAKEMLGYGKTGDFGKKVYQIWNKGNAEELRKLSEYNLRDSELTYEIFKKIYETLLEFTKLTNIHTRSLSQMFYSQLTEWYIINNAVNQNRLIKNRPTYKEIGERNKNSFVGGFVYEPTPGLYRDIALFDFRSLYPSIIVTHNIDPETFNCSCCKLLPHKIRIDAVDYKFCKKEKGFVPKLVEGLLDRKIRVKEILRKTDKSSESYQELKARQYALKTISSAFYGYMAFSGARWYSIECARSVTGWGRKYTQDVIDKAKSNKLGVIYGDTDSVFLHLQNETLHGVKEFLRKINKELPGLIELEYEGYFKTGIFIGKKGSEIGAKKRYALLTDSDELIIKGLESVRGDWSELAKEAQLRVLEIILKERNPINAEKYISQLIEKVKKREIDINKLAIRTRITKALSSYKSRNPYVVAAEISKEKGKLVLPGMFVKYVIKEGSGTISSRVMLLEDANINNYDVDYYIDQQIIRAVYKLFDLFDINMEQIRNGQTSLGDW